MANITALDWWNNHQADYPFQAQMDMAQPRPPLPEDVYGPNIIVPIKSLGVAFFGFKTREGYELFKAGHPIDKIDARGQ